MTVPVWLLWVVAVALALYAVVSMVVESTGEGRPAVRRLRFVPLVGISVALVVAAILSAVSPRQVTEVDLRDSTVLSLALLDRGGQRIDTTVLALLVSRDLDATVEAGDRVDRNVNETVKTYHYLLRVTGDRNGGGPAACLEERVAPGGQAGTDIHRYDVVGIENCRP